jgi:Family of unknown function (DUF5681)
MPVNFDGHLEGTFGTKLKQGAHSLTRHTANTDKKQPGGQFKPGQSGNPNGRPTGSRNRATLAIEALLEGEGEALRERQ